MDNIKIGITTQGDVSRLNAVKRTYQETSHEG